MDVRARQIGPQDGRPTSPVAGLRTPGTCTLDKMGLPCSTKRVEWQAVEIQAATGFGRIAWRYMVFACVDLRPRREFGVLDTGLTRFPVKTCIVHAQAKTMPCMQTGCVCTGTSAREQRQLGDTIRCLRGAILRSGFLITPVMWHMRSAYGP